MFDRSDRILGGLLGTALGDSLGELSPRLTPETLQSQSPGSMALHFTDDTLMTLGVCQCLIECGDIQVERLADIFMADVLVNPERAFGTGVYILMNLRKSLIEVSSQALNRHVSLLLYGNEVGSYGNGAPMRSAPIGLWYAGANDQVLYSKAKRSAAPTHTHPVAVDCAATMAKAISYVSNRTGFQPAQLLRTLYGFARTPELRVKLMVLESGLRGDLSPDEVFRHFKLDESAIESFPAALMAFLLHPEDFSTCLTEATKRGGDTDTLGAMAGALCGAFIGYKRLPKESFESLELKEFLVEAAMRFYLARTRSRKDRHFRRFKEEVFPAPLVEESLSLTLQDFDKLPLVQAILQGRQSPNP